MSTLNSSLNPSPPISKEYYQKELVNLTNLSVNQLRAKLREYNLKVSGLKAELVERLRNHYNSKIMFVQ